MDIKTDIKTVTAVPASFLQEHFPEVLEKMEAVSTVLDPNQLKLAFSQDLDKIEKAWEQKNAQENAAMTVQKLGPQALDLFSTGQLDQLKELFIQNEKALWAVAQLASQGNQEADAVLKHINTQASLKADAVHNKMDSALCALSVAQRQESIKAEAARLAFAKATVCKKTTAEQWLTLYMQVAQQMLNEQYKGDLSDWVSQYNESIIWAEKCRRCAPLANDWWGKKEKASRERQVDKEVTQQLQRAVLVEFPEPGEEERVKV